MCACVCVCVCFCSKASKTTAEEKGERKPEKRIGCSERKRKEKLSRSSQVVMNVGAGFEGKPMPFRCQSKTNRFPQRERVKGGESGCMYTHIHRYTCTTLTLMNGKLAR